MVENKAQIFKVIKSPVKTQDALPDVMKDALGYEFFTYEEGAPLELDPTGDAQDYRRKVNKLAWDITQLLETLGANASERDQGFEQQANRDDKPTIYLAECSYDKNEAKEILEGELRRHGYRVLPDRQLPRGEQEYIEAVKLLLDRCALSIHLVGGSYGAVPDGPTMKSAIMLQNELAAQRSKSGGLTRLIWLPDGTRSEQPRQQEFIDALHQDAEVQFGADLITSDLESLKTSIHATLKKLQTPVTPQPEPLTDAADRSQLIYLICTEKDRKDTVPVAKYLRAQGFDVSIPAFEGDATAIREAHQQLLANCDGVILYYGAGEEAWKRTLDNDLKKMPSYRSGRPVRAKYTYLAAPIRRTSKN